MASFPTYNSFDTAPQEGPAPQLFYHTSTEPSVQLDDRSSDRAFFLDSSNLQRPTLVLPAQPSTKADVATTTSPLPQHPAFSPAHHQQPGQLQQAAVPQCFHPAFRGQPSAPSQPSGVLGVPFDTAGGQVPAYVPPASHRRSQGEATASCEQGLDQLTSMLGAWQVNPQAEARLQQQPRSIKSRGRKGSQSRKGNRSHSQSRSGSRDQPKWKRHHRARRPGHHRRLLQGDP